MHSDLQRAIDAIHVRFGDQALVRATRVAIDEGSDRALAHASSLTIGFQRIRWVWDRNLLVGLRARLACLKNKLAALGGAAELEVRYALGATLLAGEPVREVSEVMERELLELPQWRPRSAAG
jgi:hypothetical protein